MVLVDPMSFSRSGPHGVGFARLEYRTDGDRAVLEITPQGDRQTACERDDIDAPHPLAGTGKALVEPVAELAAGLQASSTISHLLRRKRVCKSRFTPVGLSVAALPHSIYVLVRFPACQPADHAATVAARSPRAKVICVVLASIVAGSPMKGQHSSCAQEQVTLTVAGRAPQPGFVAALAVSGSK